MSRYTVRSDTSSSPASTCALTRPRTCSNASIEMRRLARMSSILAGKSCHWLTGLSARMDRYRSNWRRQDMIKSQPRKTANMTATTKSFEEARYDAPEGQAALTQADFAVTYTGDLVGESSSRMLVAYTEG